MLPEIFEPGNPLTGQRGTPVSAEFLNALLGRIGNDRAVTAAGAVLPTDGYVFASTANGGDSYNLSLPDPAACGSFKTITIKHIQGAAGLVTIPAAYGMAEEQLAPGQGITIARRTDTVWEIIGRV